MAQLQIGSTDLGCGENAACSMRYLAKEAKYSTRQFFRVQARFIEEGYIDSDHKKSLAANREYTPKFWRLKVGAPRTVQGCA